MPFKGAQRSFSFCQDTKSCCLIPCSRCSCSQTEIMVYLPISGKMLRTVRYLSIFLYLMCLLQKYHSLHFTIKISKIFPFKSLTVKFGKENLQLCYLQWICHLSSHPVKLGPGGKHHLNARSSNFSQSTQRAFFVTLDKILGTERTWLREGRRNIDFQLLFPSLRNYPLK